MPLWLTIVISIISNIPTLIKFVKDIIDIWNSIHQLPQPAKSVASYQFRGILEKVRAEKNDDTRKGILQKFHDEIKARLARV